ncbi:MAG: NfeD family protein [Proteobacteria bacterium]|nr:MAG: NfeD family protein [Pseudomonadota bacterium]
MQNSSYILLGIGALLIVAEIFVPGFVLFPIGVGILTSVVWTFVFDSWVIVLPLMTVHAVVSFLLFQKFYKHSETPAYKSNTDSMIGQKVLVTETIEPKLGGYVKLYGDLWKAISKNEERIMVGEEVVILNLDGNKVIVSRI